MLQVLFKVHKLNCATMLNNLSGLTQQNLFLTKAKPSVNLGDTLGQLSMSWQHSRLVAFPGVLWQVGEGTEWKTEHRLLLAQPESLYVTSIHRYYTER